MLGRGFPRYSLYDSETSLRRALKYSEIWSRSDLAKHISDIGKSAKSGSFKSRLASLRYFKLVQDTASGISVSDLGKRLVSARGKEHLKILQEAVLSVDVFKELIQIMSIGSEFTKDQIIKVSIEKLGISSVSTDRFVRSFIKSAKHSQIIEEVRLNVYKLRSFTENTSHISNSSLIDKHAILLQDDKHPLNQMYISGSGSSVALIISGIDIDVQLLKDKQERIRRLFQNILDVILE